MGDLLDAINRLGERIGPATAPETLRPEDAPVARSDAAGATADAIGQSVASHIAGIPVLRDIANNLGILNQGLRSQAGKVGPMPAAASIVQPFPPMPAAASILPGPGKLPAIGGSVTPQSPSSYVRPQVVSERNPADMALGAANRAFGSVPVVGTIIRQAAIAKELIGYLPELSKIGKAIPVATQVASTGANAAGLATAATGAAQGMEAAATSAGVLATALAHPVGATIILTGSFVAVGAAVVGLGKAISDSNRSLAGYNAAMAASFAESDIRGVFRDMASSARRAGSQVLFQSRWNDMMDKMQPVMDKFANAMQDAASSILQFVTPVLEFGNWLDDWMREHSGTGIGGAVVNTVLPFGVKEFGGLVGGAMDLMNGEAKNFNTGGGSSTYLGGHDPVTGLNIGPVKFHGYDEIYRTLSDTITAIQSLDKTLQEANKTKHPGQHNVTAAAFMAGVATSNFDPKRDRHFDLQQRVWQAHQLLK